MDSFGYSFLSLRVQPVLTSDTAFFEVLLVIYLEGSMFLCSFYCNLLPNGVVYWAPHCAIAHYPLYQPHQLTSCFYLQWMIIPMGIVVYKILGVLTHGHDKSRICHDIIYGNDLEQTIYTSG